MTDEITHEWKSGEPPKRGAYKVKSDAKEPNYGYRYWTGEKWGPLWSRRDWCAESKGAMRRNSHITRPVLYWGKL